MPNRHRPYGPTLRHPELDSGSRRFPLHRPCGPYEKYFKRPLDIACAGGVFICFWWLFVIIAVLVRIKLGSPVLFTQERPGKDEKIFKLYKFRTMTDEKDKEGKLLSDSQRLTTFGKFLRSTSLDELPEVFNILKGEMSVVGPRPLLVEYLPYYTPEERHRHDVRPGLTGLAQVNGRNRLNWDKRLNTDVQYIAQITFLQDFKIVFQTIIQVFKRSDIVVDTTIQEGNLAQLRSGKVMQI